MDEENLDDKEEQSEERRAARVGQRKTTTPTLAEREEHERTHIPNRSWCRHCVAARASRIAHRGRKFAKVVEDDKDMKQVNSAYYFMRDQPGTESAKRSWCRKIELLACEFQRPHRTYVQGRDICNLSIKCIRFGKVLAYTRSS